MSNICIKLVRHDDTFEDIWHSEERSLNRVKNDMRRFAKMSDFAHLKKFYIAVCDDNWQEVSNNSVYIKSGV